MWNLRVDHFTKQQKLVTIYQFLGDCSDQVKYRTSSGDSVNDDYEAQKDQDGYPDELKSGQVFPEEKEEEEEISVTQQTIPLINTVVLVSENRPKILSPEEVDLLERKEALTAQIAELQVKVAHTVDRIREEMGIRVFLGMIKSNMSDAEARVTSASWLKLKNSVVTEDLQLLLDAAYDLVIMGVARSAVFQTLQRMKEAEVWTVVSSTLFWLQYLVSLVVAGFVGALCADRRRARVLFQRLAAVSTKDSFLPPPPPIYTPAAVVVRSCEGKDNIAFDV